MKIIVSVGSGKGGTGKSMVLVNLALMLAKKGKKVCVVDLDIGGANAHILFGLFEPERTLSDFLLRRVSSLNDVVHTFDSFYGLKIIPGSGETLQTANMSYQEKKRLLRAVSAIDAEIILLDVGAGTGYNTLDFFMYADLQICVTMADPTSISGFYKFIQLATIRKALTSFLSQSEVSKVLKKHNFQTISDVFAMADQVQEGASLKIQHDLDHFHPLLVINKTAPGSMLNTLKLKKLTSKYLGIQLPDLGKIPADSCVVDALHSYLPVCEYTPTAKSSLALNEISEKLLQVIGLFKSTPDSLQTLSGATQTS